MVKLIVRDKESIQEAVRRLLVQQVRGLAAIARVLRLSVGLVVHRMSHFGRVGGPP